MVLYGNGHAEHTLPFAINPIGTAHSPAVVLWKANFQYFYAVPRGDDTRSYARPKHSLPSFMSILCASCRASVVSYGTRWIHVRCVISGYKWIKSMASDQAGSAKWNCETNNISHQPYSTYDLCGKATHTHTEHLMIEMSAVAGMTLMIWKLQTSKIEKLRLGNVQSANEAFPHVVPFTLYDSGASKTSRVTACENEFGKPICLWFLHGKCGAIERRTFLFDLILSVNMTILFLIGNSTVHEKKQIADRQ